MPKSHLSPAHVAFMGGIRNELVALKACDNAIAQGMEDKPGCIPWLQARHEHLGGYKALLIVLGWTLIPQQELPEVIETLEKLEYPGEVVYQTVLRIMKQ